MHKLHNKFPAAVMALFMTVLLFVPVFTSCSTDSGFKKEGNVYIEGYTFGGKVNLDTLELQTACGEYCLEFDSDWLTSCSNEKYNAGLAEFSALLSSDVYPDVVVSFDVKDADPEDNEKLLADIGFDDVVYSEITEGPSGLDDDDGTALVMAHREITDDGTDYDVFVAVVSETRNEVTADWLSNFDLGSDDENYYARTGDHPEWLIKKQHKGFDVAASRVKSIIDRYISGHKTEGNETRLLLTGHSRGGAIANILGAQYEDDPDIFSYTYALACPTTTTSAVKEYKTVFNLINTEDFVSVMPLPEWGFCRYGTDITGTVSDYEDEYDELTGLSYRSPDIEGIQEAFAGVAENNDRSDVYEMHEYVLETDDDYTQDGPEAIDALDVSEYFELSWTAVGDISGGAENDDAITGPDEEDYDGDDTDDMVYTARYCNAFLMKAMAEMIADRNDLGQIVTDTVHTDVLLDLTGQDILSSGNLRDAFSELVINAAYLPWPHFTASYIVLASHSAD